MKEIFKYLSALAMGAFVFTSCEINDLPKFNDKDAFVAFNNSSVSVSESAGTVSIPITLASVKGISASVSVEAVDGSAKSGVNYTVETSSVSFSANAATQNVVVKINDIDGFTGDLSFTLKLGNTGDVNAGNEKTCTVTIVDKDHPLDKILGTYKATTKSGRGSFEWEVTLAKDASDPQKVWILDLDPYFASYGYVAASGYNTFYGVVSEDLSEIAVPANQALGYYDTALVICDENYDPVTSGNIMFSIDLETITITVQGMWGIDDDGWWNYYANTVLVKQ